MSRSASFLPNWQTVRLVKKIFSLIRGNGVHFALGLCSSEADKAMNQAQDQIPNSE
jgi:hypothetical protein